MLRTALHYLTKATGITARIVFLILFLRFFIIEPGEVNGQSMEPKLRHNEFLLVNKVSPLFASLRRGDIVQVFLKNNNDEKLLVKRIVGLPGETIVFKDGALFVRQNQESAETRLKEPYLRPGLITQVPVGKPKEITIPSFSYLVLGDNRSHSLDSRYFGPVHRRDIVGTVMSF